MRSGRSTSSLGSDFSSGADLVGQTTRDLVSNLVEPYIDDTLALITGNRIELRPTIGPDGFEVRAGLRTGRKLRLQFSLFRGLLGRLRFRSEGGVWLVDYLWLRMFFEQLNYADQQGITEQIRSGNLELSLTYPLRF